MNDPHSDGDIWCFGARWWQGGQHTWGNEVDTPETYVRIEYHVMSPYRHLVPYRHTFTKYGITQNAFDLQHIELKRCICPGCSQLVPTHVIKSGKLLCSRLQTSLDTMTEMILCRWHIARLRLILMIMIVYTWTTTKVSSVQSAQTRPPLVCFSLLQFLVGGQGCLRDASHHAVHEFAKPILRLLDALGGCRTGLPESPLLLFLQFPSISRL